MTIRRRSRAEQSAACAPTRRHRPRHRRQPPDTGRRRDYEGSTSTNASVALSRVRLAFKSGNREHAANLRTHPNNRDGDLGEGRATVLGFGPSVSVLFYSLLKYLSSALKCGLSSVLKYLQSIGIVIFIKTATSTAIHLLLRYTLSFICLRSWEPN